MDAIEVTARFDAQGKIVPLSFVWERRTYRVDSVGRRWEGKDGRHILVMTPGNRTHHLLFMPDRSRWYLVWGDDSRTASIV